MSVVTVEDLHTVADPHHRLERAAIIAGVQAGMQGTHRLIVRVPDRAVDGVRVFRADDIARMLQRYGHLREISVTDGGTIVAAADIVKRRGEVAVWTGYAIGPWHPSDITRRGLGGSETAAVRLSEEFAAMGYIVTLYGQFEQAGMCGDVMLRDFREFDPTAPLDALIGFRNAQLFDQRPNARFAALWLEDLAPAEGLTPARAANIDKVFGVTDWHKGQIQRAHPWIHPGQVVGGRNGITHEFFQGEPAPQREKRVLFTSSPDRGLDVLLEIWPRILEQVPDAELVSTYSRWYDLVASRYTHLLPHREMIEKLSEQPGVHRIKGGLGQRDLAHLMRSSMVWAHPSYYTDGRMEFHETSCISAMEAQAAGLVVVAGNWGALTETVRHGTLIDGDPAEKDGAFRDAMVSAIVQGLSDESVQAAARTMGPEMVRGMDWRGAAEQVAGMFAPSLNGAR